MTPSGRAGAGRSARVTAYDDDVTTELHTTRSRGHGMTVAAFGPATPG